MGLIAPRVTAQLTKQLPGGEKQILSLQGEGVQIYACQAKAGAAGQWVFVAPEAKLIDQTGAVTGSHGAGPAWHLADGSSVVGEVMAKGAGATAEDIPELLLRAKSHAGQGRLAAVEYIQRAETRGGVAPAAACDATHDGALARVPYRARYIFFGAH